MGAAVTMYCSRFCGYCTMAERLLRSKGVDIETIRVDTEPGRRSEMEQRSGRRSVPQIFIGDIHVGGFMDLAQLERDGRLDDLLGPQAESA